MSEQPTSTRLPDTTIKDIDGYAESRGISRAKAIRELVENALETTQDTVNIASKTDLQRAVELQEELEQLINQAEQKTTRQTQQLESELESHIDFTNLDSDLISAFTDKPYVTIPKAENEAWVAVPRFVPFTVGWLDQQTESYNIFVINKFVNWIEELPTDIKDQVGIEKSYEKAQLEDRILEFANEGERDQAWDDLDGQDGGLYKTVEDDKIQIKQGKEFEVIAELVDRGNLPFTPSPLDESDIEPEPEDIELRPYQTRAWDKFRETGMIGVYWPPGAGKTFLALYAGERVTGRKLIIVPSKTLKEQWENRINEFCDKTYRYDVETYQYFNYKNNLQEYQDKEIALTVFDEVHHLPANTFSKLATIGTKYRIGLSASPYREDGRTEYIFALSGFPVGMNWEELKDLGVVQQVPVKVYLYSTSNQKTNDVENIVGERAGKIVIFCDSIDRGKRLSSSLGVPFVHGETTNRMDVYNDNRVVISSRVGDEGLSLDDLDVVINHDFHGASRRQEIQRFGRVLHGESDGEYIIQFTDEELEKHGERLFSLEERGFELRFERRS